LMNRFIQYHWPGNIRELENFIKRFLVLPEQDSLLLGDFNAPATAAQEKPMAPAPGASLLAVSAAAADRAERELVHRVLQETRGNRKQAALKMNICYKALLNKLKRWGDTPRQSQAA
jgi:DNA-binding NtrC family response regulator